MITNPFPVVFHLYAKRGMFWSKRRVELDETNLKYFNPDTSELRFSSNLNDCQLSILQDNDKGESLIQITSTMGHFPDIKLKEKFSTIKEFKKTFDKIKNATQNKNINKMTCDKPMDVDGIGKIEKDNEAYISLIEQDFDTYRRCSAIPNNMKATESQDLEALLKDEVNDNTYYRNSVQSRSSYPFFKESDPNINININSSVDKFLRKNRQEFTFLKMKNECMIEILTRNEKVLTLIKSNKIHYLDFRCLMQKKIKIQYAVYLILLTYFICKLPVCCCCLFYLLIPFLIFYYRTHLLELWSSILSYKIICHDSSMKISKTFIRTDNYDMGTVFKEFTRYYTSLSSPPKFERLVVSAKFIADFSEAGNISQLLSFEHDSKYYKISAILPFHSLNEYFSINSKFFSKLFTSFPSYLASRTIQLISPGKTEKVIVEVNEDVIDHSIKEENEITRLLPILDSQLEEFKCKQWKVLEAARDYNTFYFDEKSGFRCIKAEALIKAPFKMVYTLMSNADERGKWDPMFDSGRTLRVINVNVLIQYMKFKGKFVYSPRDFVMVIHRKTDLNTECTILCKSYTSIEYPKCEGCERAELLFGAMCMTKIDDKSTLVTLYSCSDMKIAQYLVNTAIKDNARCIKHLKDLLEKGVKSE